MKLHEYIANCRTIAEVWQVYERCVLPKNAPPVQRIETRRSFYAAADWLFHRMIDVTQDEEDAARLYAELQEELAAFAREAEKEAGLRVQGRRGRL